MCILAGLSVFRLAEVLEVFRALTQNVPVDLGKRALVGLNLEQRSAITVMIVSLNSNDR